MLNRAVLMGRVVRTPELRITPGGVSTATFTLAVERDVKDKKTGERGVDFIDVVTWRQTAEFAAKAFTKGRLVVAEGRILIRPWTTKSGEQRKSYEIIADHVYPADAPKSSQEERRDAEDCGCGDYSEGEMKADPFKALDDDLDDDLPF